MENDLWMEIQQKTQMLDRSIRQLRISCRDYAESERKYKIILAQECLKMRSDGMPVTLIEKTCYGLQSVADARFARDVAEGVYKANFEAINSIKLQLRLLEGQLGREWGAG